MNEPSTITNTIITTNADGVECAAIVPTAIILDPVDVPLRWVCSNTINWCDSKGG